MTTWPTVHCHGRTYTGKSNGIMGCRTPITPATAQLVSGSGDSTVRIWDTLPGKERVRLAKTPAGTGDPPADRKTQ